MRILIEIDTKRQTSKIIQTDELTANDYIRIICEYFSVPFESLTEQPLKKYEHYALARKFIIYFLDSELSLTHKEIEKILNYREDDIENPTNLNVISYHLSTLQEKLNKEDSRYTRPYKNLLNIISKFNLKKLDNE